MEIFKDDPDVILLNYSYKTNLYNMNLLNLVGITGMNTTVHLAQAYMKGETAINYKWALNELKQMLIAQNIALPLLFLVDKELSFDE